MSSEYLFVLQIFYRISYTEMIFENVKDICILTTGWLFWCTIFDGDK